jgi:predicted TPR repeat methyltransferase
MSEHRHSEESLTQEPAQEAVSIPEALAIAVDHHRRGEFARAHTIYARILEAHPGCAEALHFLGLLLHQTGDRASAVRLIREAIALEPEYADAHCNLGNVLKEEGRLKEAEAAYRAVVALSPGHTDAQNNLGTVLKAQGRLDEAERVYRKVIDLAPEHAIAHNNLGNVLMAQGDIEGAAAAYRRAIALRPNFAEAYHNAGLALQRLGRLTEAESALRKAVALGAEAYVHLGRALREQGKVEEALRVYRKAVQLSPTKGDAWYNLAMLLQAIGKTAEAAKACREWLRNDPSNPVAKHMLAGCTGEEVPARAENRYIQAIFDGFAPSFDARLSELGYRAPEVVMEAVRHALPASSEDLHVLDAGCGTGLCGPLLRPLAKRLIGVDLSQPMLDTADELGVYDALIKQELTEFLKAQSAAFDLIASADTLCYFGRLDEVFSATAYALRPGGVLVFTLEKLEDDEQGAGFRLNPNGRYSHAEPYVRSALECAGLTLRAIEPAQLRTELGRPVAGWVVSAVC